MHTFVLFVWIVISVTTTVNCQADNVQVTKKDVDSRQSRDGVTDILSDVSHLYRRQMNNIEQYKACKADYDNRIEGVTSCLKILFGGLSGEQQGAYYSHHHDGGTLTSDYPDYVTQEQKWLEQEQMASSSRYPMYSGEMYPSPNQGQPYQGQREGQPYPGQEQGHFGHDQGQGYPQRYPALGGVSGSPDQMQRYPGEGQEYIDQGQHYLSQGIGMQGQGLRMPGQTLLMQGQGQGYGMQGQMIGMQGQGLGMQGQGLGMQGQGLGMQGQGYGMQGQGLGMQGHEKRGQPSTGYEYIDRQDTNFEPVEHHLTKRQGIFDFDYPREQRMPRPAGSPNIPISMYPGLPFGVAGRGPGHGPFGSRPRPMGMPFGREPFAFGAGIGSPGMVRYW